MGVLALQSDLRLATLARAREALKKASHQIQVGFRETFEQAILDAGPKGWLDWLVDYRNMVVHRGRRLSMNQLLPRSPQIFGSDGQVILRSESIAQLPSEPDLSQIEAFLDPTDLGSKRPPVLTESAVRTMQGALESSLSLVRSTGGALVESWRTRRQNPSFLPQPVECWPQCWPEGIAQRSTGFSGYDPGRLVYEPSAMIGNSDVVRPMSTAALFDHLRDRWRTFD